MSEQTEINNSWLDQEMNELSIGTTETLPSLKFEENKIIEFTIDASKPFQKWKGTGGRSGGEVTKAIIPVMHQEVKKNLWLNIKNPLYGDMIKRLKLGQVTFKVIQVGSKAETQYKIID